MVLLVTPDGRTLRLRDVAEIRRTTANPPDPLARINGRPAVMVGTRARAGVRIDDYGAEVAEVIDRIPRDAAQRHARSTCCTTWPAASASSPAIWATTCGKASCWCSFRR